MSPRILYIFLAFALSLNAQLLPFSLFAQQAAWRVKPPLGFPFLNASDAEGLSMPDTGYVLNGNTLWRLNKDNTWTLRDALPGITSTRAVTFGIGSKAYVLAQTKQLWEYNPVLNTWTRKSDFPGTTVGTGFSVADHGYVVATDQTNNFWQYDPVADNWTQKTNFPAATISMVAFSLDNKGYVSNSGFMWAYSPSSDSWSEVARLPSTLDRVAAFTIGAFGYVGTASNNPFQPAAEFWQYDPSTNTWTKKSSLFLPWNVFGFSAGGHGYIGGWGPVDKSLASPYYFGEYTPGSNSWTLNRLTTPPRERAVAFTIGQKGYVGTGFAVTGTCIVCTETKHDFWEYDGGSGKWSQKPDFPGGDVVDAVGFGFGNKGYLLGSKGFWEFDALMNRWTRRTDFPGDGYDVAFSIGNRGYVETGGSQNNFWQYDPSADRWTMINNFPGEARSGAVAFTIQDKGYVATGVYGSSFKRDLWAYDPGSGRWSRKADLPGVARTNATGFSIEGYGYLGTGLSGPGVYLNDFWKYDPQQDKWAQELDFGGIARSNAVAFSIGNKGYITTGSISSGPFSALNDLWEFSYPQEPNLSPIAGAWFQKYYNPTTALLAAWDSRDPEGGKITYLWEKTAGPAGSGLLYSNSASPVVTGLVDGSYTFRLTVTDDQGATGTASLTFTVSNNLPPIAGAWLQKFYSPTSALLAAWDSHDPEGGPITYYWEKIAGPEGSTLLYWNSASPVANNLVNGVYTYRLTVTDDHGATGWKDLTFTVSGVSLSVNRAQSIITADENANSNKTAQCMVYPNPVKDILNFRWVNEYSGTVIVTLMDMSGRKIKDIRINKTAQYYNGSIELNRLKPGQYYLHIRNENKSFTKSFMKE